MVNEIHPLNALSGMCVIFDGLVMMAAPLHSTHEEQNVIVAVPIGKYPRRRNIVAILNNVRQPKHTH